MFAATRRGLGRVSEFALCCVVVAPCKRARAYTTRELSLIIHVGMDMRPKTRMHYFGEVGITFTVHENPRKTRFIFFLVFFTYFRL